jgi:hypothetical protein
MSNDGYYEDEYEGDWYEDGDYEDGDYEDGKSNYKKPPVSKTMSSTVFSMISLVFAILLIVTGTIIMWQDCEGHMLKKFLGKSIGSWIIFVGFPLILGYAWHLGPLRTYFVGMQLEITPMALAQIALNVASSGGKEIFEKVARLEAIFHLILLFISIPGILKVLDVLVCYSCERRLDLIGWTIVPINLFKFIFFVLGYIPGIGHVINKLPSPVNGACTVIRMIPVPNLSGAF